MKKVLITGAAGFIAYHLTNLLLSEDHQIVGLDNMNDYYDPNLKYAKLPILGIPRDDIQDNHVIQSSVHPNFKFVKMDLADRKSVEELLEQEKFDTIIHLAAQAGVQYSLKNPHAYLESNLVGFVNLIEASKQNNVGHFIYASSSSVYGDREDVPFSEEDRVDHPISMYAATKKSNELMAHAYSHLFGLKTTGLRFFTVYGPWGRPDMAPYIFMDKILKDQPIEVFNNGDLERDFTYVGDIVQGVKQVMEQKSTYEVYNIGNSNPVNLMDFIHTLEKVLGKKADINFRPMRKGDVYRTYSDVSKLQRDFNYRPNTSVEEGLRLMADWFHTV